MTSCLKRAVDEILKGEDPKQILIEQGFFPDLRICGQKNFVEAVQCGILEAAAAYVALGMAVNSLYDGETPLTAAAVENQLSVCKFLLVAGADLELKNKDGNAPLHVAVVKQNLEMVQLLLEAGADVNVYSSAGTTPLGAAAEKQNLEVMDRLIKAGAEVKKAFINGRKPLLTVLTELSDDKSDAIEWLLQQGADPNEANAYGWTALMNARWTKQEKVAALLEAYGASKPDEKAFAYFGAAERGDSDAVKRLLAQGIAINMQGFLGCTALIYACKNRHAELAAYLLSQGADLEKEDCFQNRALHYAAQRDLELVRLLVEAGAEKDILNAWGEAPLSIALNYHKDDIGIFLVQKGANVNLVEEEKSFYTPFQLAVCSKNSELIKLFLDAGADINGRVEGGDVPLTVACEKDFMEAVLMLLKKGADTMKASKWHSSVYDSLCHKAEYTKYAKLIMRHDIDSVFEKALLEKASKWPKEALIDFIKSGKYEELDILLQNGFSSDWYDERGETPLHLAIQKEERFLVTRLLRAGADSNLQSKAGMMPLHLACSKGDTETVKLLLSCGAKVNKRDHEGRTALYYAVIGGEEEIFELLEECGIMRMLEKEEVQQTFLHAAAFDRPQVLRWLLKLGAEAVKVNGLGENALHIALKHNAYENLPVLVEAGVNPQAADHKGQSALNLAKEKGQFDIYEDWMERLQKEDEGKHPTTLTLWKARTAALQKQKEKAEGFIEQSYMSLEEAIRSGSSDRVRELIAQGAPIPLRDKERSLFEEVIQKNRLDLMKLLVQGVVIDTACQLKRPIKSFGIPALRGAVSSIRQKKVMFLGGSCDLVVETSFRLPQHFILSSESSKLVNQLRSRLLPYGFLCFTQKKGFNRNRAQELSCFYLSDPMNILRYYETSSPYYGVTTEAIINQITVWQHRYEAEILGAGKDWVSVKFNNFHSSREALQSEVRKICPQTILDPDFYYAWNSGESELFLSWV